MNRHEHMCTHACTHLVLSVFPSRPTTLLESKRLVYVSLYCIYVDFTQETDISIMDQKLICLIQLQSL